VLDQVVFRLERRRTAGVVADKRPVVSVDQLVHAKAISSGRLRSTNVALVTVAGVNVALVLRQFACGFEFSLADMAKVSGMNGKRSMAEKVGKCQVGVE
jgi:hypothetical protein